MYFNTYFCTILIFKKLSNICPHCEKSSRSKSLIHSLGSCKHFYHVTCAKELISGTDSDTNNLTAGSTFTCPNCVSTESNEIHKRNVVANKLNENQNLVIISVISQDVCPDSSVDNAKKLSHSDHR